MPKQSNRPTNTNWQNYVLDFSNVDFSQFADMSNQQKETGFWEKVGNSALAIGEGITMLPMGIVDTVRDAYNAGDIDVTDSEAIRARRAREQERAVYAKEYEGKAFEGVADAMNSIGYSLTTMGATLGAGAAGSLAGPVVGAGAGMAAAGTVAYRASKQQFLHQMLDKTEQVLGRMPTQEEWDKIAIEFDGEATRYGAWEAGPEALSNLFMTKLLGPLGKGIFKGSIGQGLKRVGGLYGEEFATETVTQMGQGYEEARAGLRGEAPGAWEAFKEIAPATFWQTTLMAGGKKGADVVANRMRRRAADVENNTASDEEAQSTLIPSPSEIQRMQGLGWLAQEEADAETRRRDMTELRSDILMRSMESQRTAAYAPPLEEQARVIMNRHSGYTQAPVRGPSEFLNDAEADSISSFVQKHEPSIDMALDEGQTLDLLQEDGMWRGLGVVGLNRLDAESFPTALPPGQTAGQLSLPSGNQRALPPGSGVIYQGSERSGLGPMPMWADSKSPRVDATIIDPRRGQTLDSSATGGMMQGLGFAAPVNVAATPTAGQITNTQKAPRADTTAQAAALGMPAPNPMQTPAVTPQAAPSTPQAIPAAAPQTMTPPTRQPAVAPVRQPAVSAVPDSSDAAPLSREEARVELSKLGPTRLREMFEGQERKRAGKMTKAQLVQELLDRHYPSENEAAPAAPVEAAPVINTPPIDAPQPAMEETAPPVANEVPHAPVPQGTMQPEKMAAPESAPAQSANVISEKSNQDAQGAIAPKSDSKAIPNKEVPNKAQEADARETKATDAEEAAPASKQDAGDVKQVVAATPDERGTVENAAEPQGKEKGKTEPDVSAQKGIALKIGEHIGGSRADTAQKTGSKPKKATDATPAWRKRFVVAQTAGKGEWRILHAVTGRPVVSMGFESAAQAEAMVPIAAVTVKHRVRSADNGTYKIVRLVTDRKRTTIKDGFATEEDAKRYMVEHAVEILEKKTGVGEEILPAPEDVHREGTERRKGDIEPQHFLDDFGFRGAEFGKWNNMQERQDLLNHAYDALMDLAEILGVPPKALSLNGELGIAFGARGQGLSGAKAHYEPSYAVINLTKVSGAGSLAHEWMHALDNYFARQDGKAPSVKKANKRGDMVYPDDTERKTMASHGFLTRDSGVRKVVREAYAKLVNSLYKKGEQYVEDTKRAEEFVGKARDALRRELDGIRRDLASNRQYGQRFTNPATEEQLSRFDALAERLVEGENLTLEMRGNPPVAGRSGVTNRYSNDLLDGISAILKPVRGRSGFNAERHGVLDRVGSMMLTYKQRADMLRTAQDGEAKTKNVPTRFAMEARRLDEGRASDYWTHEHEMLARAFSSYVEDRAAEKGIRTDFLVYGANNDMAAFKFLGVRPYPEGAERVAINKGFEELFEVLEAKETEKGVALASLRGAEEQSNKVVSRSENDGSGSERKAKVVPSEHLPPKVPGKSGMPASAVQHTIDAFGKRAKNAAPAKVVQSIADLPANIREAYAGHESALEAAYDPENKTVWLVADNLTDTGRVAEVWMHEQVVHHGLRDMLSDSERKRVLNQLWLSMGGMGNSVVRSVADAYGLNPRNDVAARMRVMEEVLASMAEKRQAGTLTPQETKLWKKIVDAVLRAWKATVQAVSGKDARMAHENIDNLLSALGRHVLDGTPARAEGQGEGRVGRASVDEKNTADKHTLEQEAWDRVREETQEWGRELDEGMALPEVDRFKSFRVCSTPDVLKKLGAKAESVQIMHPRLLKIRDKHNIPLDLLRDLPQQIADPLMVFKSDTMANAFVVLTELEHNGENLVAAIHFDVKEGRATVNDIASIHDRKTAREDGEAVPGWIWFRKQAQKGNLRYYDKNRSPRWFRERAGLQLSGVMNRESYRGIKILTDKDIVKPVNHNADNDNAPLASLASISLGDILNIFSPRKAASLASAPEIKHLFDKKDLGMLQSVVQLPHWIAKEYKAFSKVYERQLQRMEERAKSLKDSLATVPSLFGESRLKDADMKSLQEMLWAHEGKEPESLKKAEKFNVREVLENGREVIEVNPSFYTAYKKWVDGLGGTPAAQKALLEVRKSLDADLVAAHNRMAAMEELGDDAVKKFRQIIGHIPNYFPHHRYGNYFVQAKIGDKVVYREHFDAPMKKSAMDRARQIVAREGKNYPGAAWMDGENTRLPDEVLGAPVDSDAMEQIIMAAAAKIPDKGKAQEISSLLLEGVADVLKVRGWGAHGIQRKNVPGYEKTDIARVLYDYKSGLNGWLTKMEAARDFSAALSEIDARKNPNLWKYSRQYVKDMLRNSDSVDRVAGNIKSVAFAWYLGGNIKTAFVNATQNIIVGVPRLQMDVSGGGRMWLKGAQDALVNRATGGKGKGLSAEDARLIKELHGESIITDAYMEEVRGQLQGVSGARMWNKFTQFMGKPMSEVELFNRSSLSLAAFRAARQGKLKEHARKKYGVTGKVASYEQAKAFAADVVRDAHFVYGKSNAPEFLRSTTAGRFLSPMYTFRTFTHNMVNMWAWALCSQGREGAAFVAKSIGATIALGGLTAVPLYATLAALAQAATGDDEDWTERIRKYLPQNNLLRDAVCYGAPAIAGVYVGGSLQMETPLTRGFKKGDTPKEVMVESLGDLIGIPYDLFIEKPSRVMDAHSKGNTWRMVEEVVPTAMKNVMQAWRLYNEGQTAMSGRPINSPGMKGARKLTEAEATGKALGFQPVSSTKSYAAYEAGERAKKVRSEKVEALTVLGLRTRDGKDPAGRPEMMREMRNWNEKMKAEGKPHMLIRLKDVESRMKARRREGRLNAKTRREQERYRDVWGV